MISIYGHHAIKQKSSVTQRKFNLYIVFALSFLRSTQAEADWQEKWKDFTDYFNPPSQICEPEDRTSGFGKVVRLGEDLGALVQEAERNNVSDRAVCDLLNGGDPKGLRQVILDPKSYSTQCGTPPHLFLEGVLLNKDIRLLKEIMNLGGRFKYLQSQALEAAVKLGEEEKNPFQYLDLLRQAFQSLGRFPFNRGSPNIEDIATHVKSTDGSIFLDKMIQSNKYAVLDHIFGKLTLQQKGQYLAEKGLAEGKTALHLASERPESLQTLQWILQSLEKNKKLAGFINRSDRTGRTAIESAHEKDNWNGLSELLKYGINPSSMIHDRSTRKASEIQDKLIHLERSIHRDQEILKREIEKLPRSVNSNQIIKKTETQIKEAEAQVSQLFSKVSASDLIYCSSTKKCLVDLIYNPSLFKTKIIGDTLQKRVQALTKEKAGFQNILFKSQLMRARSTQLQGVFRNYGLSPDNLGFDPIDVLLANKPKGTDLDDDTREKIRLIILASNSDAPSIGNIGFNSLTGSDKSYLVSQSSPKERLKIVRWLLTCGQDPNQNLQSGTNLITLLSKSTSDIKEHVLWRASDEKRIQLEKMRRDDKLRPIQALLKGRPRVASTNSFNLNGLKYLNKSEADLLGEWAKKEGDSQVLKKLLEFHPSSSKALQLGDIEQAQRLSSKRPKELLDKDAQGWNILHHAASMKNSVSGTQFLDWIANLDEKGKGTNGEMDFNIRAVRQAAEEALDAELPRVDKESKNEGGLTPFDMAAKDNNLVWMEKLIDRYPSKIIRGAGEQTRSPLDLLTSQGKVDLLKFALQNTLKEGNKKAIKRLLEKLTPKEIVEGLRDEDKNKSEVWKKNLLPFVQTSDELFKFLAVNNKSVETKNVSLKIKELISPSRETKISHSAAASGNEKELQADIYKSVHSKDEKGRLPLHIAVVRRDLASVKTILEAHNKDWGHKIGEKSILSLNTRDDVGKTAIHYAAAEGDPDIVNLLLKSGAQTRLKIKAKKKEYRSPDEGKGPLLIAMENGHLRVVEVLIKNMGNKWGKLPGFPPREDTLGKCSFYSMIQSKKPKERAEIMDSLSKIAQGENSRKEKLKDLETALSDLDGALKRCPKTLP